MPQSGASDCATLPAARGCPGRIRGCPATGRPSRAVLLPPGDHAAHAAAGIGHVAGVAGDHVDVGVHHRLAGGGSGVREDLRGRRDTNRSREPDTEQRGVGAGIDPRSVLCGERDAPSGRHGQQGGSRSRSKYAAARSGPSASMEVMARRTASGSVSPWARADRTASSGVARSAALVDVTRYCLPGVLGEPALHIAVGRAPSECSGCAGKGPRVTTEGVEDGRRVVGSRRVDRIEKGDCRKRRGFVQLDAEAVAAGVESECRAQLLDCECHSSSGAR